MMADYGCDTIECTGVFSSTTDEEGNTVGDQDKLDEAMRTAFKIVKSYKRGEYEGKVAKYLKGSQIVTYENKYYYFTLNDGAEIWITGSSTGQCTSLNGTSCAYLIIDINGKVPPNTLGKDVFVLGYLTNYGDIIPEVSRKWEKYSQISSQYWRNKPEQCGTSNKKLKDETITRISGQNCLARIMENNWRMDYLH